MLLFQIITNTLVHVFKTYSRGEETNFSSRVRNTSDYEDAFHRCTTFKMVDIGLLVQVHTDIYLIVYHPNVETNRNSFKNVVSLPEIIIIMERAANNSAPNNRIHKYL